MGAGGGMKYNSATSKFRQMNADPLSLRDSLSSPRDEAPHPSHLHPPRYRCSLPAVTELCER